MEPDGKKHYYEIDTGLSHSVDRKNRFYTDKEAWNAIAKDFDAHYKTGGMVMGILYRYDSPIYNIHPQLGCNDGISPSTCRMPVAQGYLAYDWDGKPWNNPTNCKLCGCSIPSKRFRNYGHCEKCQPVIHSLISWEDPFGRSGMMHGKERVKADITQFQLDCLKKQSEDYWEVAMFLIRDKTLTLVDPEN